ncbi:MAG: GDSL-type esterase/lipase family protein [Actinomycetota bacterium]|nr:GDSL-type esterase/lipase family protein [Actinomycetota bacterium]
MKRLAIAAIGVIAGLAALSGSAVPAEASGPVAPPPSSMAATGDSLSRGFATGSADCNFFGACPQYSWSTGTAVNSHYERLLALNPALGGHATNAAVPGAQISGFAAQAATVAASHPDYVTVLFGAGDICSASTTPAQFATQFRAGMDALFAASPNSRVLVASILSLESLRAAVLAGNPSATWSFCGTFFNASPAGRALIMDRVAQYNTVLETECATYANCLFDGDALFNHVWSPGEVSTVDNVHPSAAGQEMMSQVLYDAGYTWAATPTDKNACKRDGWKSLVDGQGRSFKDQGYCVSYVTTGGAKT